MSRTPADAAAAPVPPAVLGTGRSVLLWRLGLLLTLAIVTMLPAPWRPALLFVWGAAALSALLVQWAGVPATAPAPGLPPPPLQSLLLLSLTLYALLTGLVLVTGSLALAGLLAPLLVALALAALLPRQDTAGSARLWALAVGGAVWASLGVIATNLLATWALDGIPPVLILTLAFAAWSAARRALLLQGLRGRLPESLGVAVGLTAIVMTATGGIIALAIGFVAGLLLVLETLRLLPPADPTSPVAAMTTELTIVHHYLVITTPLVLLGLAALLLIH